MQRVVTATGTGVVNWLAEIVPPEKPLERLARFIQPEIVLGAVERLQTGRNGGSGLDRLLIKFRARSALAIKAAGTDGTEVTGFSCLHLHEPAQTAQAGVHWLRMIGGLSTDQQCVRERSVRVGQLRLKPQPAVAAVLNEPVEQPLRQGLAHLVHVTIAAETLEVVADAGQGESPGPRRIGADRGGQGPLEELGGPHLQAPAARASDTRAQGPERTAMGILRASLLEPAAVETHEV